MKLVKLCAVPLLFTASFSFGQAVLTASNFNYRNGDKFVSYPCDTMNYEGSSGAGVTWDFSTLTLMTATDSLLYKDCSPEYHCIDIPGSNLVEIDLTDSTFQGYMLTDTTKMTMMGVYSTMGGAAPMSDPYDYMRYPFTYTNSFRDSFFYSSSGFYNYGYNVITCDGYGTLVLPWGSYPNTLRLHILAYSVDSGNISGMPFIDSSLTTSYRFVMPGNWVTLNIDYSNSFDVMTPVHHSGTNIMKKRDGLTRVDPVVLSKSVEVFPNPVADKAIIKLCTLPTTGTAKFILKNSIGQVVNTLDLSQQETMFNRNGLPTGIYVYELQMEGVGNKVGKVYLR